MSRVVHPFTTKEAWLTLRARNLNSTEVAALFGKSPYLTLPELWDMKKNGIVQELEDNERMFWGRHLQDSIARGAAEKHGWEVRPKTEYIEGTEQRVGSSFDWEVWSAAVYSEPVNRGFIIERDLVSAPAPVALLEVKNVDWLTFKQQWVNDDQGLQAPVHIELQVQHQMLVSGFREAFIAVLVGGNTLHVIRRGADADVQAAMIYKAREFWRTIDASEPPTLDFEQDAAFILTKYRDVVPRKTVDVREDTNLVSYVRADRDAKEQIEQFERQRQTCKARMAVAVGDAEVAIGPDFKITSSLTKKGERSIRVTWAKEEQQ